MNIKEIFRESADIKIAMASDEIFIKQMEGAIKTITSCYHNNGAVYFCGNGGSAADAQHLAAELSGRFYFDRPPLAAEALHVNTSYLTAVANDYSYNEIYARMIKGIGRKGDVLIGISTSGNSENILRAFEQAKSKGMTIIAFTGASGGKMKDNADFLFNVPSTDTPRIQEAHILIGHTLCQYVESNMFPR